MRTKRIRTGRRQITPSPPRSSVTRTCFGGAAAPKLATAACAARFSLRFSASCLWNTSLRFNLLRMEEGSTRRRLPSMLSGGRRRGGGGTGACCARGEAPHSNARVPRSERGSSSRDSTEYVCVHTTMTVTHRNPLLRVWLEKTRPSSEITGIRKSNVERAATTTTRQARVHKHAARIVAMIEWQQEE